MLKNGKMLPSTLSIWGVNNYWFLWLTLLKVAKLHEITTNKCYHLKLKGWFASIQKVLKSMHNF